VLKYLSDPTTMTTLVSLAMITEEAHLMKYYDRDTVILSIRSLQAGLGYRPSQHSSERNIEMMLYKAYRYYTL